MRAIVFPGQGSQFVGMGKDLANSFVKAKRVFEEINDALNQDLYKIMTEGPKEELILTENAQPAIMAIGIAMIRVLKEEGYNINQFSNITSGHSLGEYTSLTAAESITLYDSSKLLKTGYKPKKNINDAISELKILYNKKILLDKPNFRSIQWLKAKLKRPK